MKKKSAEPTLLDVAGQAGVSIATVSRVLNAKNNVRPDTADRILAVMDELGYPYASEEAVPRNRLIAVVLPNLDNPFYAKIVTGIQSSAKSHRYEYMIYLCKDVDIHRQALIEFLHLVHACGVILLSPVIDPQTLAEIDAVVPLVQCAEYNEQSSLPYVGVDDYAAAQSAVEYLLSKGRRRIALINGPQRYKYARQRYAGYATALKNAGLQPDPSHVFHVTEMGFDSAYSVAQQLLLSTERPDAILAAADMFAAAAVKAANSAGILVPKQLSVISFDNTFISTVCYPSITAVNMPQFQLGYMACEVLAERMTNSQGGKQSFLLKTELVIRESA